MNPVIDLSLKTIDMNKQALVFVNTKRSAEKTAEDISKKCSGDLKSLSEKILNDLSKPTKQCIRLSKCVKKGIAFHHAGLTSGQKSLIEDAFRDGTIRIICCTPTLAAGLDLPAFRTIIKDLKRFGPRGMQYIPVLEYLQMAGRAGRPGYETYGESICIAQSEAEKEEIVEKYLHGEPEDIYSKLAVEPVLRTYLLSLIATKLVSTKEEILDFFEETFWAHQFKDMNRLEMIIEKMLDYLEHWEFIRGSGDFVAANEEQRYKVTYLGRRVSELYIDPYTAHGIIKGLRKGGDEPMGLLHLMANTLEMRPLLRVRAKEMDDIQEILVKYEDTLLVNEPSIYEPEYEEFLDALKTASCLHDWIDETSEEDLLEKYSIRPGELKVKIDTCDWLLYAAGELARIQEYKDILKAIMKLRVRLQNGVKEELLTLLKLKGIGRVKARRMFSNQICTIKDVKEAEPGRLAKIIGQKTAQSVKKQVGQDVKIRIGQVNLSEF
ncbi:MAG: helicase-related protein [Candidatus Woesearchaeota archaeon]